MSQRRCKCELLDIVLEYVANIKEASHVISMVQLKPSMDMNPKLR